MHVTPVDAAGLEEVLAAPGVVLVSFWAEWCGPCRLMTPVVEEVAAMRPDVTAVSVDTEAHPELAQRWGVRTIPSFHLRAAGAEVAVLVGARTKPELLTELDEARAAVAG